MKHVETQKLKQPYLCLNQKNTSMQKWEDEQLFFQWSIIIKHPPSITKIGSVKIYDSHGNARVQFGLDALIGLRVVWKMFKIHYVSQGLTYQYHLFGRRANLAWLGYRECQYERNSEDWLIITASFLILLLTSCIILLDLVKHEKQVLGHRQLGTWKITVQMSYLQVYLSRSFSFYRSSSDERWAKIGPRTLNIYLLF